MTTQSDKFQKNAEAVEAAQSDEGAEGQVEAEVVFNAAGDGEGSEDVGSGVVTEEGVVLSVALEGAEGVEDAVHSPKDSSFLTCESVPHAPTPPFFFGSFKNPVNLLDLVKSFIQRRFLDRANIDEEGMFSLYRCEGCWKIVTSINVIMHGQRSGDTKIEAADWNAKLSCRADVFFSRCWRDVQFQCTALLLLERVLENLKTASAGNPLVNMNITCRL